MMKTLAMVSLLAGAVALAGCESRGGSAILGGGVGAAAGAGGYEYHLNRQKTRVEDDFKAGRINQQERDIRLNQISRDSLIQ